MREQTKRAIERQDRWRVLKQGKTYQQVADLKGVTRQRAHQIIHASLNREDV